MSNWAILSGIEANLEAYEAVMTDIKRQTPQVTDLYILGDLISATKDSEKVIDRICHPKLGEPIPQVCKGWWEEQCLILHGFGETDEPTELIQKYGIATAKELWDNIPKSTVEWIYNLHFAFMELDCLLVHGSSISVSEELSPQTSPLQLFDRVSRAGANRLFCGRSGQTFRYHIKDGSVCSTVTSLDKTAPSQTFETTERVIIGVGNVGHIPHQATYALYSPNSDILQFKTVRYGSGKGFQ